MDLPNLAVFRSAAARGAPLTPLHETRLAVFTHHKCGSSALFHFLQQLARLNGLAFHGTHLGCARPPVSPGIACLTNAAWPAVRGRLAGPAVHFIRNPLDLVVSAWHSHARTHPLEGWPRLANQRARLEVLGEEAGLYATAQFCDEASFYPDTPGPLRAMREWDYDAAGIVTLRAEDCIDRFSEAIGAAIGAQVPALAWPDQSAFAFAVLSGGREAGVVDEASHYRSGRAGEWRDVLPRSVIGWVVERCGEVLARFYPGELAEALKRI